MPLPRKPLSGTDCVAHAYRSRRYSGRHGNPVYSDRSHVFNLSSEKLGLGSPVRPRGLNQSDKAPAPTPPYSNSPSISLLVLTVLGLSDVNFARFSQSNKHVLIFSCSLPSCISTRPDGTNTTSSLHYGQSLNGFVVCAYL